MLKPTKLFGVTQKKIPVFFINHEEEGFWFTSSKSRLVGEARQLKDVTVNMQKVELANSWLVVEIMKDNRELVLNEFKNTNPDDLSSDELNKLIESNGEELDLKLEIFIRSIIQTGNFRHPVIWEYRNRLTDVVVNSQTFDFQIEIVKAGFKYRLVTSEEHIQKDSDDPEKGYLLAHDISNNDIVGYPISDVELASFNEQLILQVYRFCQSEFNGNNWQTTKDLKSLEKIVETIDEKEEQKEGKLHEPLKPSDKSKTVETQLTGTKST